MRKIVLEEHGYFWWHDEPIPDGHFAPESSITGVLKIDEEGQIELELHGVLPNQESASSKFIQGILKGTDKHTLLMELSPHERQFSTNGISYEGFSAINCLIGDSPFPYGKALLFRKLEVDLKGYEEWLRLGSIEVNRTQTRVSANYKKPKDITYLLDDGKITIKYDCYGSYQGKHRRHDLSLSESVSLTYGFIKAITPEEIKAQHGLLEDLFILLADSDYCLDWPLLSLGNKKYTYYFLRNRSSARAPKWYECGTSFVALRESFGQIFSTWKKKREVFGPGFSLYLATRRGMTLYSEHRFVTLIWGIESFHKTKNPDKPHSFKVLNKIQRILEQVTAQNDKEWLRKRLSPKYRLADRIFEIFQTLPLGLDEKMLCQFSSSCARKRNDISHGVQRGSGDYSKFAIDLERQSNALAYLYHALLLQEVGVDERIINQWIYQGYQSHRIKNTFVEVGLLNEELGMP